MDRLAVHVTILRTWLRSSIKIQINLSAMLFFKHMQVCSLPRHMLIAFLPK